MAAIIPAAAIGAAVGAELPKFFNDALDQFAAGEGNYLRDGEPEGIVAQVGQAVGRAYCRLIDSGNGSGQPLRDIQNEKVCRPYLESINPGGGPGLQLPFRGGQCDVLYQVVTTGTLPTGVTGFGECAGSQNYNLVGQFWGPIGPPRQGVQVCGGTDAGEAFDWVVTCFGNSAEPRTDGPVTRLLVGGAYSATIDSVTPLNNVPDDCGNPAPVPVVRPPGPTIDPPPFPFNPAPNVDIDVDVRIGPNGDIIFDIGDGPVTVDPFPNPDPGPGGGGDGDGGGPSDGPPGDVGDPGPPSDTGGDGQAEGEAGEGEVLTGLKVDILVIPPGGKQYAPGVYRGVCYIYMGTDTGLDHDPAGAMLRSGQFVFAEKDNLTKWAVSANDGYNLRVTPYYRQVEP